MTPTRFTRLLIVGWVVLGVWTGALHADDKRAKKGAKPNAPVKALETTVVGEDPSKDVAESLVLVHAQHELEAYLRTQTPRITRLPSKEYIQTHLLSNRHEREDQGKVRISWEMKVGEKQYQDMLKDASREDKEEREAVALDRMTGLGKILAVVVAFLIALTGYLRLEETTKGYYTTWLRLGAISFVAAVGIGMWLAC
jgi:hypothetical protein